MGKKRELKSLLLFFLRDLRAFFERMP